MTDLNMKGCTLIQVLAITINIDKKQKFTLTCTKLLVFKCELLMMNTVTFMVYDIVHINESKKDCETFLT